MRLGYQVTLDEIVDIYDRALVRSPRIRRWLRINSLISGILAGLIALPFTAGSRLLRVLAVAVAFIIGSTVSNALQRVMRRRHLRRLLAERFGTGPTEYEVEAKETGIRARQGSRENEWGWGEVEAIEERPTEVAIWIRGGALILIRLDRVGQQGEGQAFLELARKYANASLEGDPLERERE